MSAQLASISATEPALLESHADPTPAETPTDHAPARLVSPTTQEFAHAALKAHSGALHPASASSSAAKTQPTPPQLAHVPATQDSDFSRAHARPVRTTTSSPTDTA